MKKLAFLVVVLLFTGLAVPATAAADVPSDAVTVSVTGNGTWSDGHLSVSLFPGEEKYFVVDVHNNLDISIHAEVRATPGCVDGLNVTACFCPYESTLSAGESYAFNLTITASGVAPPGTFSIGLTVETSTEILEPDPDPDPDPDPEPGLPHHVTLAVLYATRAPGAVNELVATVFDEDNTPLSGVPVGWVVLVPSGNTTLTEVDLMTDANGRAAVKVLSDTAGSVIVRCEVAENTEVTATATLIWIDGTNGGNGNGGGSEPSGLPAWAVFLIFIGAIVGAFAAYLYIKRWREKRQALGNLFTGKQDDDTLED